LKINISAVKNDFVYLYFADFSSAIIFGPGEQNFQKPTALVSINFPANGMEVKVSKPI